MPKCLNFLPFFLSSFLSLASLGADYYNDPDDLFDSIGQTARPSLNEVVSPIDRENFSTGVLTSTLGTNLAGRASVLQTDGSIIVGGRVDRGTLSDMAIARYNPDGTLDQGFGTSGFVTSTFSTNVWQDEIIHGLALQTDGKIIGVGKKNIMGGYFEFTVLRYLTTGTIDTSFNTQGWVSNSFNARTFQIARAVQVDTTGSLVVSGYSWSGTQYDGTIARYTSDGRLDTSYSTTGFAITALVGNNSGFLSLTLDTLGNAVAAGNSYNGSNWDFAVARYLTNGSLDTSFNTTGKLNQAIMTSDDTCYAVIQNATDGTLYASGGANNGSNLDLAAIRLLSDGHLDTTFATTGKLTTTIGTSDDVITGVGLQTNGYLYASGYFQNNSGNKKFVLARYKTDGKLDTSFSTKGYATTSIGANDDFAQSFSIASDDSFIQAGRSSNGSALNFAIARYNTNGTLALSGSFDLSFGTGGKSTAASGSGGANALQADRKLIVAGYGSNAFKVSRLLPTGTLDTSYSSDGSAYFDIANNEDMRDWIIQTDGKTVGGGSNQTNFGKNIIRVLTDGNLDTSFATDGYVNHDIRGNGILHRIVLQTDGKFVIANNDTNNIYRVTTDGRMDTTFNRNGYSVSTITFNSVAIDTLGRIVSGGVKSNDSAIVRLLTDGRLDTAFFTVGTKVTAIDGSNADQFYDVAADQNGRIVAAGYVTNPGGSSTSNDIVLARFFSDGNLDTSFYTSGKVLQSIGNGSVNDTLFRIRVLSSNKIIVSGEVQDGFPHSVFAARYQSNGVMDTAFRTTGYIVQPNSNQVSFGYQGLAITPKGSYCVTDGVSAAYTFCLWP